MHASNMQCNQNGFKGMIPPPPLQSVRTVTVSFLLWIMQHLHHGTVFNASPVHPVFLCFFVWFFLPNLQHASYDLQQISSRTHNCICNLQAFVKRVHKGARDLWANAEVACCNSNSMIISGECNDLFCLCITVRVVLLFRVCCVLPVCLVASVCYSSSLCIVWNIYLLAMSFM